MGSGSMNYQPAASTAPPSPVTAFQKMSEQDLIKVLIANLQSGQIDTQRAADIIRQYTGSAVAQRRITDAVWAGTPQLMRVASKVVQGGPGDVGGGEPESEASRAVGEGARFCYYVSGMQHEEDRGWQVATVVENMPGYYLTDWYWGKGMSYDEVQRLVDEINQKKLGLSPKECFEIIDSSMRVSDIKAGLRTGKKGGPDEITKMIDHLPKGAQKMWRTVYEEAKKHAKGDPEQKGRAKEYAARTAWDAVKKKYKSARPKSEKKGWHQPGMKGGDDFKAEEFTLKPKPFEADAKRVREQESEFNSKVKGEGKEKETARRAREEEGMRTKRRLRAAARGAGDVRRHRAWWQGTMEQTTPEGSKTFRLDPAGGPVETTEKKQYDGAASETLRKMQQEMKEKERTQRASFSVRFIPNRRSEMHGAWYILKNGKPVVKAKLVDILEGEVPPADVMAEMCSDSYGRDILAHIEKRGLARVAYDLTGLKIEGFEKPDRLAGLKQTLGSRIEDMERRLIAMESEGIECKEGEELLASLDELKQIQAKIGEVKTAGDRIRIRRVARYAIAEGDEKVENVDTILKRLIKDFKKLQKAMGKEEKGDEEEGIPMKGRKPKRREKEEKDKGKGEGVPPPPPGAEEGEEGKPAFPPRPGSLRRKFFRRVAAEKGRPEYGVTPKVDYVGLAHKVKAKDYPAKEVLNEAEAQKQDLAVAKKMPTGKQGAAHQLMRRRGIKASPEQVKYFKEQYGDPKFAAELGKDYSKDAKKAAADEAAIRMRTAMELAEVMVEKQLLPADDKKAKDEQVNVLYAMSDEEFARQAKMVANIQPKLELSKEHWTVKSAGNSVEGFIDGTRVANWAPEELPTLKGQIVQSSLKTALDELIRGDRDGAFDHLLNHHLSGDPTDPQPVTMTKAVSAGQIDQSAGDRHADNPALRRLLQR